MRFVSVILRYIYATIALQSRVLSIFWNDPKFFAPCLVIWVATFGGSLHSSVTPYFYNKVGATDTDIGYLTSVGEFPGIFVVPFYGWLMDFHGAYLACLLSTILCAVGCAIRGFAFNINSLYIGVAVIGLGSSALWTITMSFVASQSSREDRSAIISAYVVQITALRLIGRGVYPLWDFCLIQVCGEHNILLRYRISMSVCTFFCFFGFFVLTYWGKAFRSVGPLYGTNEDVESSSTCEKDIIETEKGTNSSTFQFQLVPFLIICIAMVIQAIATAIIKVVWPLWLRDAFGWSATEFAWLLLASSILSTVSIAVFIHLLQTPNPNPDANDQLEKIEKTQIQIVGTLNKYCIVLHILFIIIFKSTIATLEPALKAMGSLLMPRAIQGRTFGSLNACMFYFFNFEFLFFFVRNFVPNDFFLNIFPKYIKYWPVLDFICFF
eukprot:GSMAST32.ASY1.ANO1.2029.1 assembled CDS